MKHFRCRKGLLFALAASLSVTAGSVNTITTKSSGVSGSVKTVLNKYAEELEKTPLPSGINEMNPPVVVRVSRDKIRVSIDPSGNSFATMFAIEETVRGKFIQADHTFGDKPVFQTFAQWGNEGGFILVMPRKAKYEFKAFPQPAYKIL